MEGKKVCKRCNVEKVSVFSHRGSNGGRVHKDDKGRQWKASVCPDCQAEIRRETRAYIKSQESSGGQDESNT